MLMVVLLVSILLMALALSVWIWHILHQQVMVVEELSAIPLVNERVLEKRAVTGEHPLVDEDRLCELKDGFESLKASKNEDVRSSAALLLQQQAENEVLKAKLTGLEKAILAAGQDSSRVDNLIVENAAFRSQLESIKAEVSRSRNEIFRLEQENEDLRAEAIAASEARVLLGSAREEYQRQLNGVFTQVEEFRDQNARLQQQVSGGSKEDLQRAVAEFAARVRELETVNAMQTEKNEYLQYELAKRRAQIVGLERFSEAARG